MKLGWKLKKVTQPGTIALVIIGSFMFMGFIVRVFSRIFFRIIWLFQNSKNLEGKIALIFAPNFVRTLFIVLMRWGYKNCKSKKKVSVHDPPPDYETVAVPPDYATAIQLPACNNWEIFENLQWTPYEFRHLYLTLDLVSIWD